MIDDLVLSPPKIDPRITQAIAIATAAGLETSIVSEHEIGLRRGPAFASLRFDVAHLFLELIVVEREARHRHCGSAMLKDIIRIAEHLHMPIDLLASAMTHQAGPGLSQRKLKGWYRRHGFIGTDVQLRRLPTAA